MIVGTVKMMYASSTNYAAEKTLEHEILAFGSSRAEREEISLDLAVGLDF